MALLRTMSLSAPWLCLESGALQSSRVVVWSSAPDGEAGLDGPEAGALQGVWQRPALLLALQVNESLR